MRILTPFVHQLSPGPLRAPNGHADIDWSHPLTRGLRGCWLPGVSSGRDLTGKTTDLLIQSSGGIPGGTQEGVGLKSITTSTGMAATIGTGNDYTSFSEMTLYWRGYNLGKPPDFSCLIGISYTNTDSNPYIVANLQYTNSSADIFTIDWNSNGIVKDGYNSGNNGIYIPRAAGPLSVGAICVVGGVCSGYSNGIQVANTVAFGAIGPTSTANSTLNINGWVPVTTRNANGICVMAAIWTRALTPYEMAWLHNEPYSFLIPSESEMPIMLLPAAPSVIFRKSASRIGTRIGTRQTWAA